MDELPKYRGSVTSLKALKDYALNHARRNIERKKKTVEEQLEKSNQYREKQKNEEYHKSIQPASGNVKLRGVRGNFHFSISSFISEDLMILLSVGGVGFIPLIFLYISSYVFKFCEWHRMPLHYLTIVQIICLMDYYFVFPISLLGILTIHVFLFVLLISLIIYFKCKQNDYNF